MSISIRWQIRAIATIVVASSVLRPIGYYRATQATGKIISLESAFPGALMSSYEIILAALCAWGLLKSRSWARWVALVLVSQLAALRISSLPGVWREPPADFAGVEFLQWMKWGTLGAALLFSYLTWLLLSPKMAQAFERDA